MNSLLLSLSPLVVLVVALLIWALLLRPRQREFVRNRARATALSQISRHRG